MMVMGTALAFAAGNVVNVSSNDGSGTNAITGLGATVMNSTGKMKSTHGNPDYFSGKVVYGGNTDHTCGRMAPDVTSTSLKSRDGTCHFPVQPGSLDGGQFRICKNINNLPDTCGGWSSTSRL
jgi:hypothetical protein